MVRVARVFGAPWQPASYIIIVDESSTAVKPENVVQSVSVSGDELRAWRDRNGVSQRQLAVQLEVDVMTISRWEREVQAIPPFLPLALETLERRKLAKRGGKK
jgi:DNA-binding transcriptional regulator YiaG